MMLAAVLAFGGLMSGLPGVNNTAYADGTTWTGRTATEQSNWQSIAYGNGKFVAVASTGTNPIMTSPDGINWTAQTAPENNQWNAVAYGNGRFVAVAGNGTNRVMTSTDGETWTAHAAAEQNYWMSITYGNGLFVAVSDNGTSRVMTSPDGINWTARSAAEQNQWLSVTYADGTFVAVAATGTNRVMTSANGTSWTAHAAAEQNYWTAVTHGGGTFVATAADGINRVMTSTDGETWTARVAAEQNVWADATYGNGLFVAVSQSGTNRVMTSPDGATWTARTAPASEWREVTYVDGLFVAVAGSGTDRVMTSGVLGSGSSPVGLHGYVRDSVTNDPIPFATVNVDCGEGLGPVGQADANGQYSFTHVQLADALEFNCYYGYSFFASADDYQNGPFELDGNRNISTPWLDYVAATFDNQAHTFYLTGTGGGSGDPLDFTDPADKTVVVANQAAITDLSITGGNAGDELNINLYVEDGSLAFGSSAGLTFTGASSGNNLQLSGTKGDINAALATLQYTAPHTTGAFKLEALINEAGGGVVWANNGHAYKVVAASGPGIEWADAKDAAESQTFGGVNGYLATITSAEEHNFVLTRINQNGWIGANDSAGGEQWRWMTGPETGTAFWTGTYNSGPVATGFSNWATNEPNNDSAGNNDCAQIRFTETVHGQWNDLTCSTLLPQYVVEFGAPGNLPQVVNTSFTINVMPHTYTVSFDTQDGSDVTPITGIEEGQAITLPATPERAGYVFEAWTLDDDQYQPGDSFVMPDEDVQFVAIWKEDGNIDEVPDEEQENVVSLTDPATNKRITLEIDESCTMASATMLSASDLAVKDSAYQYVTDFVNFTATGCADDKTTVNLYYYGTSPDGLTVRKHSPSKSSYFTINDALLTKRTIVGQNVTVVSYEVTDGGELDIDGLKNGTIVDPVGLGRLAVGVPRTGLGGSR